MYILRVRFWLYCNN